MRDAFSRELIKIASKDSKVLLLTGDHGYQLYDGLRKEHGGKLTQEQYEDATQDCQLLENERIQVDKYQKIQTRLH